MSTSFRRATVVSLGWTLFVILWGAYVRASGSGAGCGDHWPVCNGELIPRAASMQTVIEYTHRVTSGVALLLVLLVGVWSARFQAPLLRRYALASVVLMLTEAALGAWLVKAELVADNATASRAVAMAVHLINTFLLVAAMTLTSFHAFAGELTPRWRGRGAALTAAALSLVLVVGVSGAIAALGDTLVQQSVHNDFVTLLIRLRILHPLLALVAVGALLLLGRLTWAAAPRWSVALWTLTVLQLMAGLINVVLQAPVWMQLVHLGLADAVWMVSLVTARLWAARTS